MKTIAVSQELIDLLKARAHLGQSMSGVIRELIYEVDEAVCPICGKHSAGCMVHKECADREAK